MNPCASIAPFSTTLCTDDASVLFASSAYRNANLVFAIELSAPEGTKLANPTLLGPAIFLLALTTAGGASSKPCFNNAAAYLAATYGPDYKSDENLKVRQRKYGAQTFTEVRDVTPGTNIVHTLLQRVPNRGLCLVLQSNPMIALEVTRKDKAGRPLAFSGNSQAPGNEPSVEVTYTREKSGTFEPSRCRELTYNKANEEVAVVVPCTKVLSDLN